VEGELLVFGLLGRHDGWRRLINSWRCQSLGFGEKEEAPHQNSWGNLVERTDNGGSVSLLKHVDVRVLMLYHRVAVRRSGRQDRPKITLGNVGSGIVVVSIHIVDVSGDRPGEFYEQEPMDRRHQDP
jgi:hypothetical protein